MLTNEIIEESVDSPNFNWSADAPRGGKAVMNRIIKENATVPLFFAQTLVASLRDVGYNDTTSALCEHVDNAIEAGAKEIRVYFRQRGKKGSYEIDAAVYDNGRGMAPNVLKVATSFGGSMNFNNRNGIGRFGMGMKTAALSMSQVMELYSWQEKAAIYNMTLDVNSIGNGRANLVELPEPELATGLPYELAELFIKPMLYPKDHDDQKLLAYTAEELIDKLGTSGTIVYMPNCDRLSYQTAQYLVDHATKEMARVYRRFIDKGIKIYVNNRILEAVDPTYSMSSARHNRILDIQTKQSRLITSKTINIPIREQEQETAPATIKLYKLPVEEWHALPRKILKNDLRVFDSSSLSVLRNDREVSDNIPGLLQRHSITNWIRLQIDFSGELDEAFGVATNKQGVRVKKYVIKAIKDAIQEEITSTLNEVRRFQSEQNNARHALKQSQSELKAKEADVYQAKALEEDLTPEEQLQMEENLKGLAIGVKRDGESDEEAFERVKSSKYIMQFKHDQYWPFYAVDHKFGRVILTINTAHPFYTKLYEPLIGLRDFKEAENDDNPALINEPATQDIEDGPVQALELLLLSLARTQSVLSRDSEENKKFLDAFGREWSEAYRIQLSK